MCCCCTRLPPHYLKWSAFLMGYPLHATTGSGAKKRSFISSSAIAVNQAFDSEAAKTAIGATGLVVGQPSGVGLSGGAWQTVMLNVFGIHGGKSEIKIRNENSKHFARYVSYRHDYVNKTRSRKKCTSCCMGHMIQCFTRCMKSDSDHTPIYYEL